MLSDSLMHTEPSSAASSYSVLDDTALMALVRSGNHDAFAEVVARHTPVSLALARRTVHSNADAEDVVQGVFVRLWQRPHTWQADKSAFKTWLFRVVLNACYDFLRGHSKRKHASIDSVAEPTASDVLEQLGEHDVASQQQRLVRQAAQELPAKQRDAINLAVFSGLPQQQVAQVMGVSLKAVESLLVRAKKTLKQRCVGQRDASD